MSRDDGKEPTRRPLSIVVAILCATAGALTLADVSTVPFLIPFVLPVAVLQMLAGVKLVAGKQSWWWVASGSCVLALPSSLGPLNGILPDPVALAAVLSSTGAMVGAFACWLTDPARLKSAS
jgi:hypothetical protein